jgi:hypothetical protein
MKSELTDIALIDDRGVTAVLAHNADAMAVADEVATQVGLDLEWDTSSPELPEGVCGVGSAVLCPAHIVEFGRRLTRAGLAVVVDKWEGPAN